MKAGGWGGNGSGCLGKDRLVSGLINGAATRGAANVGRQGWFANLVELRVDVLAELEPGLAFAIFFLNSCGDTSGFVARRLYFKAGV